jgi:hypothetical protein
LELIGVFIFVLGILATAVSRQLADEFKAWTPRLIKYFIQRAVRQLPESQRKRFTEEWQSHVDEIPGEVGKLIVAFGFLRASSEISRGLTNAERLLYALGNLIYVLSNNEFLASALELDLEHFSTELLTNNAELRSCFEHQMSELSDDTARSTEHFLVMLTNVFEQANELGIPPLSDAFDAHMNGVDAKTLRARYAPLFAAFVEARRSDAELTKNERVAEELAKLGIIKK